VADPWGAASVELNAFELRHIVEKRAIEEVRWIVEQRGIEEQGEVVEQGVEAHLRMVVSPVGIFEPASLEFCICGLPRFAAPHLQIVAAGPQPRNFASSLLVRRKESWRRQRAVNYPTDGAVTISMRGSCRITSQRKFALLICDHGGQAPSCG
jgi:hypothetical protein